MNNLQNKQGILVHIQHHDHLPPLLGYLFQIFITVKSGIHWASNIFTEHLSFIHQFLALVFVMVCAQSHSF